MSLGQMGPNDDLQREGAGDRCDRAAQHGHIDAYRDVGDPNHDPDAALQISFSRRIDCERARLAGSMSIGISLRDSYGTPRTTTHSLRLADSL